MREEIKAAYKYLYVSYHKAAKNKSTKPVGKIYSCSPSYEMEFLVGSLCVKTKCCKNNNLKELCGGWPRLSKVYHYPTDVTLNLQAMMTIVTSYLYCKNLHLLTIFLAQEYAPVR